MMDLSVWKTPSPTTFAPYQFLGLFFTLEFDIMGLPSIIDMISLQNLGQLVARWTSFGTDVSQGRVYSPRLILVQRIFSTTSFYDPTTSWSPTQPKTSEGSIPEFKSERFSKCRFRQRGWAFFQRNPFYCALGYVHSQGEYWHRIIRVLWTLYRCGIAIVVCDSNVSTGNERGICLLHSYVKYIVWAQLPKSTNQSDKSCQQGDFLQRTLCRIRFMQCPSVLTNAWGWTACKRKSHQAEIGDSKWRFLRVFIHLAELARHATGIPGPRLNPASSQSVCSSAEPVRGLEPTVSSASVEFMSSKPVTGGGELALCALRLWR